MEQDLKRYVQTFLDSMLTTLTDPTLLRSAKEDLGKGERCQLTKTFNVSSWPEDDIVNFSAVYFEAIAAANELFVDQENGSSLTIRYQQYVEQNCVPALIRWTNNETRMDTICSRIESEIKTIKNPESQFESVGFWAATAAVVGAAVAIGVGAALKR